MDKDIKIENKSLKDFLYEEIRKLIDEGYIPVGEKINKIELAERFNVSQTPINDALNRLLGENYLGLESRKGYFVREFTSKEFFDLFAMRAGVEGIGARIACQLATDAEMDAIIHMFDDFVPPFSETTQEDYIKADKAFHKAILQASRNQFILSTLETTGFLTRSYQKGLTRGIDVSYREHMEIIRCFKERDPEGAQKAMQDHLLNSRETFNQVK